ncbi:MAG TPA: mechanosensitive ion channel domain-containing protein, partial [Candidatus Saccharimonadales bacterium]|nr:mechanosensitive ion channel domain-containing protein [Candidatus Saccharimonadales bacterium]
MTDNTINNFFNAIGKYISEPNSMRSVIILAVAVVVAYWLSKYLALVIIKIAQFTSVRADNTSNEDRVIRLRRVETFLSITIALIRALTVAIVAYVTWKTLNPGASGYVAAIGASTVFIVLAGATVGIILRDLTAGAMMIIEHWFNVGDFIRVEPFIDVSGVVERVTLRATKLRS